MQWIKGKRLTENDHYEPLSQQAANDLIAQIDKLFDALKNDLSVIFGLRWEWQQIILKHNRILSESHSPVSLQALVMGQKLINELRYDLRESADTVIKINKVIELYRDKMKELVKKVVLQPKKLSPEQAYQQFGQAWKSSPSWQSFWQSFEGGHGNFLGQQKLEVGRRKLEKERQDLEAQKAAEAAKQGTGGTQGAEAAKQGTGGTQGAEAAKQGTGGPKPAEAANRGTGGAQAAEAEPAVEKPGGEPPPPPEKKEADPLKTASPDTAKPQHREKVIKLGDVVLYAMRLNKTQQVDEEKIKAALAKMQVATIDDVEIDHLDDAHQEKALKAGEAYLALHGGGIIGDLETGMEPAPPEQAKEVAELLTYPNKKLVEYLAGYVGQEALDAVLATFGGKVPKSASKKDDFIRKVMESKPKTESASHVQKLRERMRRGVKPRLYLEAVAPEEKVTYLKELLRNR